MAARFALPARLGVRSFGVSDGIKSDGTTGFVAAGSMEVAGDPTPENFRTWPVGIGGDKRPDAPAASPPASALVSKTLADTIGSRGISAGKLSRVSNS
jgi:hypothetical protein